MNCPLCSSPLLFGAQSCPCGYNLATSRGEDLPIELSYWESLRAFWRFYWPTQVVGSIALFILAKVSRPARPDAAYAVTLLAALIAIPAVALFLFVPRIFSRPYRGFSVVAVALASGETTRKLPARLRLRVWLFLWWRQILASIVAAILTMPLNIFLGIMGLHLSQWVAVFAGVLVVGPILMKMLIGTEFDDFRIEARREVRTAPAPQAA